MLVALLGPGLAVFSGARPLAVAWWLVAGPAFSTVPLVSASLLALILTHPREVLFVLPAQRVGAWVITGVLLVHHWADDDAAAEAA